MSHSNELRKSSMDVIESSSKSSPFSKVNLFVENWENADYSKIIINSQRFCGNEPQVSRASDQSQHWITDKTMLRLRITVLCLTCCINVFMYKWTNVGIATITHLSCYTLPRYNPEKCGITRPKPTTWTGRPYSCHPDSRMWVFIAKLNILILTL